jgi:small subunit ribosomal protein S11
MINGNKTSAAEENDVAIEQVSNDTGEATTRESRPGQLTAADLLRSELDGDVKIRRAKKCKNVAYGICHILATFNNTKVSFSDKAGAVISWSSAGKNNFRGSRKSTAYAAQVAVQDAARTAMSHGLKEIDVRIKGPGLGRDAAVRALQTIGLQVNSITDVTPLPHNGCRPKKPRRA